MTPRGVEEHQVAAGHGLEVRHEIGHVRVAIAVRAVLIAVGEERALDQDHLAREDIGTIGEKRRPGVGTEAQQIQRRGLGDLLAIGAASRDLGFAQTPEFRP